MYCHYFNNKKACPFKEECILLHEDSEMCKYGKSFERMLCMFKHEENEENCENVERNDTYNPVMIRPVLLKRRMM